MKAIRFVAGLSLFSLWVGSLTLGAGQAPRPSPAAPTFTKDVAPILFENCTGCHRPGEIAPMSLLTYKDARPHAKAIRDEIDARQHAAVARRRAARHLPQRAFADRRRSSEILKAGPRTALRGRSERPAAGARLPGRLGDGQAGRRLRDAGGLQGPGRRRDRVRVLLHPDELHRGEVDLGVEVRPGNRELVHHALAFYRAARTSSGRRCCSRTANRCGRRRREAGAAAAAARPAAGRSSPPTRRARIRS